MNKKTCLLFVFILLSITNYAQNLDDILNKFYEVNGYEKFKKVKSIVMSGMITRNDAMPLKIYKVRPDKYLMEFDVQDITAYQAYNGKVAWMTAPWTGNNKPQELSAERAGDLIKRADFDGLLFSWKEKGAVAEYSGKDTVNNKTTYKIKITTKEGEKEYYFISIESYMLVKKISFRKSQGKDIEVESMFSDFKNVEGIIFSFTSENKMGGRFYSSITYDTIELDVPVDLKKFDPK